MSFSIPDNHGGVLTVQDQVANFEPADFRNPETGVEGDVKDYPIAYGLFLSIGHRSRRTLAAVLLQPSDLVESEEILVRDLERQLNLPSCKERA